MADCLKSSMEAKMISDIEVLISSTGYKFNQIKNKETFNKPTDRTYLIHKTAQYVLEQAMNHFEDRSIARGSQIKMNVDQCLTANQFTLEPCMQSLVLYFQLAMQIKNVLLLSAHCSNANDELKFLTEKIAAVLEEDIKENVLFGLESMKKRQSVLSPINNTDTLNLFCENLELIRTKNELHDLELELSGEDNSESKRQTDLLKTLYFENCNSNLQFSLENILLRG